MRSVFNQVLVESGPRTIPASTWCWPTSATARSSRSATPFPSGSSTAAWPSRTWPGVACGVALEGNIASPIRSPTFPRSAAWSRSATIRATTTPTSRSVIIGGGLAYGPLGVSHQATEDIAIMRALPNMVVVCPVRFRRGRGGHPGDDRPSRPGLLSLRLQEGAAGARRADRFPARQGDPGPRRPRPGRSSSPARSATRCAGGRRAWRRKASIAACSACTRSSRSTARRCLPLPGRPADMVVVEEHQRARRAGRRRGRGAAGGLRGPAAVPAPGPAQRVRRRRSARTNGCWINTACPRPRSRVPCGPCWRDKPTGCAPPPRPKGSAHRSER